MNASDVNLENSPSSFLPTKAALLSLAALTLFDRCVLVSVVVASSARARFLGATMLSVEVRVEAR